MTVYHKCAVLVVVFFCGQVKVDPLAAHAISTVVCISCLIVLFPKWLELFTCNFFLLRGKTKEQNYSTQLSARTQT